MLIKRYSLKPENVLIDGDGYCVLADFGLSEKLCPLQEYVYTSDDVAPQKINQESS